MALKAEKNTKKFEFECIFSGCIVILANARYQEDHLAGGVVAAPVPRFNFRFEMDVKMLSK